MLRSGKAGWMVVSVNVRTALSDIRSVDFRRYQLQGMGVICTLNDGDASSAAIPTGVEAERFAVQCASVVAASRGCTIWIIGDTPNADRLAPTTTIASSEQSTRRNWFRKGNTTISSAKPERRVAQVVRGVSPDDYAGCFNACAAAIYDVAGHRHDAVLTAAVEPGIADVRYTGNESGDWVLYFRHMLNALEPSLCGGIALHAATQGSDPLLVSSDETHNEPYGGRHRHFHSYRDFLDAMPEQFRRLPVVITQADQGGEWENANTGWVQAVYDDIDEWNRTPGVQQIQAVVLNGWDGTDETSIRSKNGVWQDFRAAMTQDYSWSDLSPQPWRPGTAIITTTEVDICPTPSSVLSDEEQENDIIPPFSHLLIDDTAPVWAEGRFWWHVHEASAITQPRSGWVAQNMASGDPLVCLLPPNYRPHRTMQPKRIWPGDNVHAVADVFLRRTPGVQDKSNNDIVAKAPAGTALAVLAGPRSVEGLKWWLVRWQAGFFKRPTGWVADSTPKGETLLQPEKHANVTVNGSSTDNGRENASGDAAEDSERYVAGDRVELLTEIELRRTPGYKGKADSDVVAELVKSTVVRIDDGPDAVDNLQWWQVVVANAEEVSAQRRGDTDGPVSGWLPQTSSNGELVLGEPMPETTATFEVGDLAVAKLDSVHVRATPGVKDKDDDDILGLLRKNTTIVIQSESKRVDEIDWQRGGAIGVNGEVVGWIAHKSSEGKELIGRPNPLPGTTVPDAEIGAYLHTPFPEITGISQLWGENGWYYKRFSYDGIPLLGHNGIDFSMKVGTPILAVDSGSVLLSGFEKNGFGWHVLLSHSWGQSVYAHMDKLDVKTGEHVRRGQILGPSGNTGGSTGPHLHFAIRIIPYKRGDGWGGYTDPLPYLNPKAYILPNYILEQQFQIFRAGRRPLYPRLDPSSMGPDTGGYNRP